MKSNFSFLESEWKEFYKRSVKAESFLLTDPRTSLTYARMALELAINWMYKEDPDLNLPYDTSLNSLMKEYSFRNEFSHKLYTEIDTIRKVGNLAIHNKPVSEVDSEKIVLNLYYFAKWFAKSYSEDDLGDIGLFDFTIVPKEGADTLSKRQIKELQNKFDQNVFKSQNALKKEQEKNKELEVENELYARQIDELKAQLEANKVIANAADDDELKHPRNEYETRKYLIDVALREAGWDLKGVNDKEFKVEGMPLSTNPTGIGYVDYVLWNDDGKPLAVVEAKKTMESASKGENQAQLYAECIEKMFGLRPVMFYTNGFDTFIWDDQFNKKARPIYGFYTKQELQTIFFRRENRKDIRKFALDTHITDRAYQLRSIKSVAEHFSGNDKHSGNLIGTNRGALLVLATGTGKTRVSIALSKLLFQGNWAKRILFLADRVSLVKQAKRNYSKFLPDYSIVNLLEDKENLDTRLVFSTYQTMMGLIDDIKDGDERFYGVGHFDLVIFDEAHRSIYRKYQAIFHYFDSLFLGLTATPKKSIDHNTYQIFGLADKSPTDAYTFEEAVANKHLVEYRSIEVPTKFLTEGIKYNELSKEEQEEFEKEILDGEKASGNEWVDKNALNQWLFNKDTAIKTLKFILDNGIKKRGGDEIGKTIIFAKNQKHAHFLKDMLLEIDKELYGNEYAKVITHSEPKSQEFIERFCDDDVERLPQIAISVDMLDTGIDAPSVVNLVFYKPVKSYTKFWQMIGRGSRLRPDLFGPGEHKQRFLIFDLCGNFEFFSENPEGIETNIQKSLTETVYHLKLHLAEYLKTDKFKDNIELSDYRKQLLDDLHAQIAVLDEDRFDVKMKLETVRKYGKGNRDLWNYLEKKDIQTIEDELAILVKPPKGDTDLARFYDRLLYTLMIKRLETPETKAFMSEFINPISKVAGISKKLLEKTTIPKVADKKELIKLPLNEDFWKDNGIGHLEKIRAGIRDLIRYIDRDDTKYVTTDFKDEIYAKPVDVHNNPEGIEAEGKYISPFQNNVHRLEEIIRENKNHMTVSRIRSGNQITEDELKALETLLMNGKLKKEEIEKELGKQLNLVEFIIELTGLSEESVDKAFAKFINEYQLNSIQIEFLDTIKKFFTSNGKINPEKLYDSEAFKKFHSQGIDGVFNDEQADRIFKIVEKINKHGIGA